MIPENSYQLAEYARTQLGDALRTVAVLDEDDCRVVYTRDDLRERYAPEQYKRTAGSYRTALGADSHFDGDLPVGAKRATIHYHDNAFVFQFPHDDCHSLLLSVEPDVGSRLRSFVDGCQARL